MNRLEEIKSRKKEIKSQIESINDIEEIRKLTDEVKSLNSEKKDLEERMERRNLAKKLEEDNFEAKKVDIPDKEGKKMEKKFGIDSKEYRSAWAKKTMGLSDDKFTEDELRALGDAVTTTDDTFVAATANANGVNNGGLLIPTSLREDLLENISKESPIFRDIRKLQVNGNVDLPYLFTADDAKWYAETTDTDNEGMEFKKLQLTGWELVKDIVITWKLEEMSVESFIGFILDELTEKMGKALVNAVIYGDGSAKPTGITQGLTAITTGADQIANILSTYEALSDDAAVGAKVYISRKAALNIMKYKDQNDNYPYLSGVPAFMAFTAEVDPYLQNNDVIAGNPKYYILNENTPVRVDKEKTLKGRKVTYGAYGVYDGKAKPNSFKLGRYTPSV